MKQLACNVCHNANEGVAAFLHQRESVGSGT
jgi:hypothetical protein